MRNHLPVGAILQQLLWNLGKGRGSGPRGRKGWGDRASEHQHRKRTPSRDSCESPKILPPAPLLEQVKRWPQRRTPGRSLSHGASQTFFMDLVSLLRSLSQYPLLLPPSFPFWRANNAFLSFPPRNGPPTLQL